MYQVWWVVTLCSVLLGLRMNLVGLKVALRLILIPATQRGKRVPGVGGVRVWRGQAQKWHISHLSPHLVPMVESCGHSKLWRDWERPQQPAQKDRRVGMWVSFLHLC